MPELFRFKQGAKPVFTSDLWYDLTDGGYINLDELLLEADAAKVKAAVNLVRQFLQSAVDVGLLIET